MIHPGNTITLVLCVQECSLDDIRAELTASPRATICDLQLQALHARDLTDSALPYLATSQPLRSRFTADGSEAAKKPKDEQDAHTEAHKLVQIQVVRRLGQEASVKIRLHTFHVEWNAPCIATLKQFFRKPTVLGELLQSSFESLLRAEGSPSSTQERLRLHRARPTSARDPTD